MDAEQRALTAWMVVLFALAVLLLLAVLLSNRSMRRILSYGCAQMIEAPLCWIYTVLYDLLCCAFGCMVCALERLIYCVSAWSIWQTVCSLIHTITSIPFAWYPMAALTVVPICCSIHSNWTVAYLGAYCVTGLMVTGTKRRSKPKIDDKRESSGQNGSPAGLHSNFFQGMKIKIDFN